MNCLECNDPIEDHTKRGCYHPDESQLNGLCDCTMTPDRIELDALKSENARLREAISRIEGYAKVCTENRPSNHWDYVIELCDESLQGQAE